MSFTSPPYNRIRNDVYAHYDDTKSYYFEFLVQVTDELLRVTKKYTIVNIQQNHFNKREVFEYIGNYSDKIVGIVIWGKTNPQPSTNYDEDNDDFSVTNAYEYFFVMGDTDRFRANNRNTKNLIMTPVNSESFEGHGAVMKKEVADWFIDNFTREGDIVLDPFMGCATTAISCIDKKRNYIGFEISSEYCKIIDDRINKTKEKHNQVNIFDVIG